MQTFLVRALLADEIDNPILSVPKLLNSRFLVPATRYNGRLGQPW